MRKATVLTTFLILALGGAALGSGVVIDEAGLDGFWDDDGQLKIIFGNRVTVPFRFVNDGGECLRGSANGLCVYMADNPGGQAENVIAGAEFGAVTWDSTYESWHYHYIGAGDLWVPQSPDYFDMVFGLWLNSIDGIGVDTLGFGGCVLYEEGYPSGYDETIVTLHFRAPISPSYDGKYMCVDSCLFRDNGVWAWEPHGVPDWSGPHCWQIGECACGIFDFTEEQVDGGGGCPNVPAVSGEMITTAFPDASGEGCSIGEFRIEANDGHGAAEVAATTPFHQIEGGSSCEGGCAVTYTPAAKDVGHDVNVTVEVFNDYQTRDFATVTYHIQEGPAVWNSTSYWGDTTGHQEFVTLGPFDAKYCGIPVEPIEFTVEGHTGEGAVYLAVLDDGSDGSGSCEIVYDPAESDIGQTVEITVGVSAEGSTNTRLVRVLVVASPTAFTFTVPGRGDEDFVALTADPDVIAACAAELALPEEDRTLFPSGPIDTGDGGHNLGWSWHFVPSEWELAYASYPECDGLPSDVEADPGYWIDEVGGFCPWAARLQTRYSLCCETRGDIDGNGVGPSIADLVYLVSHVFKQGPPPPCKAEADVDGTGALDVSDIVYLVGYMFKQGPAPVPCQ